MHVNAINSVQHILSTAVMCIAVCKFANSDRNSERLEGSLGGRDLCSELCVGEDGIEERFRAELDDAGNEFSFGIGFE